MDLKRKLVGALFAVIAASGLLIACGADEESCDFDEDCKDDTFLCHSGFCEPKCDTIADCYLGEVCVPRIGGASGTDKVCIADSGPGEDVEVCDLEDHDTCPDEQICIKDAGTKKNKCVDPNVPSEDYFTVLVRDTTTDAGRCADKVGGKDGNNSGGTKLSYVALLDKSGATLGYGQEVGYKIEEGSSFDDVATIIDGKAPDGLSGECVEGFTLDNGVALGCNGWLMVQFKDDKGELIKLSNDQDIFVGIHGNQCTKDDPFPFDPKGLDKYEVALCTTVGTEDNNTSTCKAPLSSNINGFKKVAVVVP